MRTILPCWATVCTTSWCVRPGGLSRGARLGTGRPGAVVCVRGVGVSLRHLDHLLFRGAACWANANPWPQAGLRCEAVSQEEGGQALGSPGVVAGGHLVVATGNLGLRIEASGGGVGVTEWGHGEVQGHTRCLSGFDTRPNELPQVRWRFVYTQAREVQNVWQRQVARIGGLWPPGDLRAVRRWRRFRKETPEGSRKDPERPTDTQQHFARKLRAFQTLLRLRTCSHHPRTP